ncbi:hypothetical protein AMELA_G00293110 [Ameiurus melas]|uniref:Uncharacterized protein n=1 Tax=Ameiurus melas TaxID=219545 RepID=A0A7J5ZI00_AMEME|nr:hypothetical protein AMELA_G00293110 [Ameiurus melas]
MVQCLTVDQDYGSRVQALLDKYNAKRTLCTFIRREVCLPWPLLPRYDVWNFCRTNMPDKSTYSFAYHEKY